MPQQKIRLDITLKQYELVFRVLSSAGEVFSHGAGKSCQFYNVTGALVLEKVFKIKARPVMGAAFFMINNNPEVITYAGQEDGKFYSSPDFFHCWIETSNHYIDFTSPEFNEAEYTFKDVVPRRMFQKQKVLMSEGPEFLSKPGDFFFSYNQVLTENLLRQMFSTPTGGDLANICLQWCMSSRKKIMEEMSIMNDLGEMTKIQLKKGGLTGAW